MQYRSFQIILIIRSIVIYIEFIKSLHVLVSKADIHINDLCLSLQYIPACNLRCIATWCTSKPILIWSHHLNFFRASRLSQMIECPKGPSLFHLQKGNANDLDTEISFYHSPKNLLSDYANNLNHAGCKAWVSMCWCSLNLDDHRFGHYIDLAPGSPIKTWSLWWWRVRRSCPGREKLVMSAVGRMSLK